MTLSRDHLYNKMLSTLLHIFLILMFLSTVSHVNGKPIVASTPGSATITKLVEVPGQQHVVDIALPVSLTTTEDLIAWATYAVRLMASRINVTVNTKKNDTKSSISAGMIPKMEAMVGRLKNYLINSKPLPTKATIFHKQNKSLTTTENKVETSESDPASASSVLTRSIELYPKLPLGGVVLDPHVNPYIRYAPSIINPVYESSGTRIFPEHAIFPGIGFLPLNNKENPFASRPSSTSSPREPRTDPITSTESTMTTERMDAENIQKLNEGLMAESDAPTKSPLITVPFEAYITITREETVPPAQQSVSTTPITQTLPPEQSIPDSYSTINSQKPDDYYTTTSRDPPDEFPPFFNKTSEKLREKSTKIEVIFEDEQITTPKSEKKMKVTNKNKGKNKKKKKNGIIQEIIMKMIPKKKNSTMNSTNNDVPPIIRIISERNQKLKKQKNSKKKTRIQNITLEDDVDDYDDEKLGENDSNENDDSLNETGPSSSQEEDDNDDDEDEEAEDEEEPMGSLQPIIDLLPFVVPILEDLSDPNTKTDFVGVIQAGLPLIQGIIEGDEDTPGINIGGTIGPILASLSEGPDGQGSDIGAILGPVLTLVAPLIGPIVGPIIGPTLRLSSNPPDRGFSLGALINSVAGPLSQPIEPGGMSPFSSLVTQIVAGLSREIKRGNIGSDVGALIGSILMGVIAGTSAGLSGGSSGGVGGGASLPPAYGPASLQFGPVGSSTNYNSYGNNAVPANTVNPIQLIGMSVKDILNAGVSVVSSLITAVTGLSGASSASDSPQSYGPPPSYGAQSQNYNRPRKSAAAT